MERRAGPEFDKFAQHQRRNQDGNERDGIVLSCALAHLVQLGFIVWVVAHQNHPRSGKQQRRLPEKAGHHGGNCRHQYGPQIYTSEVHGFASTRKVSSARILNLN